MFKKFVFITGALDFPVGAGVAAPAFIEPKAETFTALLTLGAFLFFAAAALMWSAQDLRVRAPIVVWQGMVRLVAVVGILYAINAGMAETNLIALAIFDGVICTTYFIGCSRVTGASPIQLLLGKTA